MKFIFKKRFVLILSFCFLSVFGTASYILAVAPAGGYGPGDTRNPDCSPGDADCVVTIIGGADTQVQYNDGGDFAGDANFLWNKTEKWLAAGNGATNVQFGVDAGASQAGATYNTAIGSGALLSTTTGSYNVGLGSDSLYANTIGNDNMAIGTDSLYNNLDGNYNVAIGSNALNGNTSGDDNIAVGFQAINLNSTGNTNVGIGNNSGGSWSGGLTTGSGNVFLGNYAGAYANGSNEFYLDNQDRANNANEKTKALLYGVFATDPASQTLVANATLTANNLSGTNTGDQVGDGTTITGAGTAGDPFVAVGTSYQVYTALLTQTGTSAPVATPLNSADSNYLGNIVWSYSSAGSYIGTLTGAFPQDKTFLSIQPVNFLSAINTNISTIWWNDVNSIYVETGDVTNSPSDNLLLNTSVEIRVYP